MLNLWLPDEVRDEFDELGVGEARMDHCEEFARYLKQIDSRLELVFAKKGATWTPHPGRWHIVRRNDAGFASFWAILAPDGQGYSEPAECHLQALMARDANRNPRIWEDHRKAVAREKLDKELRRDEDHRRFRETLSDRLDHLFDARISMHGVSESVMGKVLAANGPASQGANGG